MSLQNLRPMVVPAYVFLCLLIGGSAQGVWQMAVLEVLAILIIAWSFALPARASASRSIQSLYWLLAASLILVAMQLMPLPAALWTSLPGRGLIVSGRALLGLEPGWSSISLAPYDTMATVLSLLPPLAVLFAILRQDACSPSWLALAICVATIFGIGLGVLQTSGPDPLNSPWYLYPISNFGVATGFFANGNHMAALLVVAVPFAAALTARLGDLAGDIRKKRATMLLGGAGVAVLLVGIALNGSLMGYGLVLPVLTASLLMVVPFGSLAKRMLVGIGLVGFLAFGAIVFSPLSEHLPGSSAGTSISMRQTIVSTSSDVFITFAPTGSGLGTFPKIYPLFENPDLVDRAFINHAHNDYVELAVELGLPGLILTISFLAWWWNAVRRMWVSPAADMFALAGAVGSASLLVHSLVDYPLRTAAMSSVFAACLALIIVSRRTVDGETDIRPTRNLVID